MEFKHKRTKSLKNLNVQVKTTEMERPIVDLFHSMVTQENFSEAIDFVAGCYYQVPDFSILRSIIFKILWENCDEKLALDAKSYLLNVFKIYPPVNAQSRIYYLNALQAKRGVLSELWVVVSHLVNSCFHHYGVEAKTEADHDIPFVKFPNCSLLLDYYVQLFIKDYDCFSFERDVYAQDKKCLVMYLLGPSPVRANNSHFRQILRWINDIYKDKAFSMRMLVVEGDFLSPNLPRAFQTIQTILSKQAHSSHKVSMSFSIRKCQILNRKAVCQLLHDMLCLIVKCIIQWRPNTFDAEVFNNPSLHDVAKTIVTYCKDAFSSPSNLRIFVQSSPLKFLQAKICEQKVTEMIYHIHRLQAYDVLTLKKIVDVFMFPSDKSKKTNTQEKNGSTSRSCSRNFVVKESVKGNTKLHQACKNNKYGDLMVLVRSCGKDINAKNDRQRTPLHEACLAESYFCADILLSETGKGDIPPVDINASDNEGFTPLHYAVAKNLVPVAKKLLDQGGLPLLNAVDKKGRKPDYFIKTQEMRDILETVSALFIGKDVIKREVPNFNNYKNYAVYLIALNFLLSFYSNMFNLYKFVFSKKHKIVVKSHNKKECAHFVSSPETIVCDEDSEFIEEMPGLIDTFTESVKLQTKEKEFHIDLELLAFKVYASSLVE